MREHVRRHYAATGHLPRTGTLKPGRRHAAELLAHAIGASPNGLARITGISRMHPTVGPKNIRRLASAFGLTTDEIRDVLSFVTGGEYPASRYVDIDPSQNPPLIQRTA